MSLRTTGALHSVVMLCAWMLLNADVAERTRVNLAVPLVATVCSLLVARAVGAAGRDTVTPEVEHPPSPSLARAA